MKTPEQMAEDYADLYLGSDAYSDAKASFLAGYKAAKDETNLPTSARWISVKERLPEVNTWCLWLYPFGPEVNQYEGIGKGGALLFHRDYYNCDDTPTHWMPLPELPKGEE